MQNFKKHPVNHHFPFIFFTSYLTESVSEIVLTTHFNSFNKEFSLIMNSYSSLNRVYAHIQAIRNLISIIFKSNIIFL